MPNLEEAFVSIYPDVLRKSLAFPDLLLVDSQISFTSHKSNK